MVRRKKAVRSEEGLTGIPDATIEDIDIDAYDSLLLTGAMDIREAIEDNIISDKGVTPQD